MRCVVLTFVMVLTFWSSALAQGTKTPVEVTIAPNDMRLLPGQNFNTIVTLYYCRYTDGTEENNTGSGGCPNLIPGGVWSSDNPAVATVATISSNQARVTAGVTGTAHITYTHNGITANSPILITVAPLNPVHNEVQLPAGISWCGPTNTDYCGTVFDPGPYSVPIGGTTWRPTDNVSLQKAFNNSAPGDVILLTAGTQYGTGTTRTYTIPAKTNPSNKWIYVISTNANLLPLPRKRVSSADAVNMPKLTANAQSIIVMNSGANYWWFSGLEIFGSKLSTGGMFLINPGADHVVIERSYIHGNPTNTTGDNTHGITANGSYISITDNDIEEIHYPGSDTQGILEFSSPNGHIRIINNYVSAITEGILFGGAGGTNNPYLGADIEVRSNWIRKNLAWAVSPPLNGWIAKNGIEMKGVQRILWDGNLIENSWLAGQQGWGMAITTRTNRVGGGGNNQVITDVIMSNNIFKNILTGIDISGDDSGGGCGQNGTQGPGQFCKSPGEMRRIYLFNNLFLLADSAQTPTSLWPPGYGSVFGSSPISGIRDWELQHNTWVTNPNLVNCRFGQQFDQRPLPLAEHKCGRNYWYLNNVDCRQLVSNEGSGRTAFSHMTGITSMPSPQVVGNLMLKNTDQVQSFYTANKNDVRTSLAWVNSASGNYQLSTPNDTGITTDGKQPGIIYSILATHQAQTLSGVPPSVVPPVISTTSPLPSGTAGTPYSFTFQASGGTPPYKSWTMSGSCPGLTLNTSTGVLSGTPTTAGTFTLTVTVQDSALLTSSPATFSITI